MLSSLRMIMKKTMKVMRNNNETENEKRPPGGDNFSSVILWLQSMPIHLKEDQKHILLF